MEQPKVTHVTPVILKAENNVVELHLSEPVINSRNMETCFRFAKSSEVSPSLLKRSAKARSTEISAPFLPVVASLSESRDAIIVTTRTKLEYKESYSLFIFDCLSNEAGSPLEVNDSLLGFSQYRFQVEEAPFRVLSHDIVLVGESLAFANRKHFHFHFSHPVSVYQKGSLRLDEQVLETILSDDRRTLLVSLDFALLPDTTHAFVLSEEIVDELGRHLPEQKILFKTHSVARLLESKIIRDVQVWGYETHADIAFDAAHAANTHLKLGRTRAHWDKEFTTVTGAFHIEGLEPHVNYAYELEVENVFGQRETQSGHFESKRLDNIAINEILASPKLRKGQGRSLGEFVELYNFGDTPVDLSGYSIEVDGKECPFPKSKSMLILPAKTFMLIVGNKFDPRLFNLPESSAILRMSRQAICGNLRSWPLPIIILKDASGRKVDQFLGMAAPKDKGFSVERLNPSAKNGKEHYCYSRSDIGPTPLRANGIWENGCE
jgi:hypothetical protein